MHRFLLKRSTAGFSMIELLAVIVIAGILATIAAPSWLGFMNTRRASAARDEILQALRQTQTEAARSKGTQTLEFDTSTNPPTLKSWQGDQPLGQGQLNNTGASLKAVDAEGTEITRIEFDMNGNVVYPDPSTFTTDRGVKVVVMVPAEEGSKSCVIVQTILGGMRTGANQECD